SLEDLDAPAEDSQDPFEEAEEADTSSGGDPFDFAGSSKSPPPPPAPKTKKASPAPRAPVRSAPKAQASHPGLSLSAQVAAQVVAVLGKKTLTIKEITELKKGDVVDFNRFPNEAVDLVANGKLMAKGELVEIEGKLGVRLIKLFD
ncbi:MAG: FliM/FliN family flagellar motor switch protein, partial [Deltaproteobacteria bacterium]|nr:FliM/FliN family flagellar motor switch protein [Deltaproteobacteria bacterium]